MAEDVGHGGFKPRLVVHVQAVVVAERLLIEVTKEMERLDTHVGSADTALEQAPEVLKAVGVDAIVDVFDGVIHNLVSVLPRKSLVGEKRISVECRASFDVLLDLRLESGLLAVGHNRCANTSAALQHPHDDHLVFRSGSGDSAGFFGKVHIAGLAADKSLVRLDLAREQRSGVVVHGHTDAMEHEPSRLLSYAKGTGHLSGANSILAVADNPESAHPLIESERGILEDRSNLETELFFAAGAEPDLAGFDEGVLLRTAAKAGNSTVREAKIERVLESAVSVREVDDCLLECVRGFHSSNLRLISVCVKYVIALVSCSHFVLSQHRVFEGKDGFAVVSPSIRGHHNAMRRLAEQFGNKGILSFVKSFLYGTWPHVQQFGSLNRIAGLCQCDNGSYAFHINAWIPHNTPRLISSC